MGGPETEQRCIYKFQKSLIIDEGKKEKKSDLHKLHLWISPVIDNADFQNY
jgi:hypothetical protein